MWQTKRNFIGLTLRKNHATSGDGGCGWSSPTSYICGSGLCSDAAITSSHPDPLTHVGLSAFQNRKMPLVRQLVLGNRLGGNSTDIHPNLAHTISHEPSLIQNVFICFYYCRLCVNMETRLFPINIRAQYFLRFWLYPRADF